MLHFSCARWEDHRRLSGVCRHSLLDPDDAQTLQILAVANELAAGDLAKETTLPPRKHLTEHPIDID